MRLCFLVVGAAITMSAAPNIESARVTSVVRADTRSGRLVRSVVLTSKPVAARVVAPKVISAEDAAMSTAAIDTTSTASFAQNSTVQAMIEDAARSYDVDPLLVHSVIQVESNYNPYAISPKGAQGLMQLIPSTARRFGVKNSFNMKENIDAGVRYLKYLQSLFPNDLRLSLAAYNAGEHAVARYGNIPPYRETEDYVYRVGKRYGQARQAADSKKAVAKLAARAVVEEYRPLERYLDAEGRLHLRTR